MQPLYGHGLLSQNRSSVKDNPYAALRSSCDPGSDQLDEAHLEPEGETLSTFQHLRWQNRWRDQSCLTLADTGEHIYTGMKRFRNFSICAVWAWPIAEAAQAKPRERMVRSDCDLANLFSVASHEGASLERYFAVAWN